MIEYFSKVLYMLRDSKQQLGVLAIGAVVASLLEAFGIGLIGPFIWVVSHPETITQVSLLNWAYELTGKPAAAHFTLFLGVLLAFIFCVRSFLYFHIRSSIYRFSYEQQGGLVAWLLSAYLSVPYSFHLSRDSAGLTKNILIETQNFCFKCILPMLEAFANLVTIFALLLLLAKASLVLLVMIGAVVLPTLLLFYLYKDKAKIWSREASESYHGIFRAINHGLGGVKETYVIGCKDYFVQYAEASADRNIEAMTKFSNFQTLPKLLLETLLFVFVVLLMGVYQVFFGQDFQKLISILAIFAVAAMRLLPSINQLISSLGLMQMASHSLDMLYHDLKTIENWQIPLNCEKIRVGQKVLGRSRDTAMKFDHEIELKDIIYRYSGAERPSLKKVSLTIAKGESIALIGKSGAGKTTLVDVLLGLLQIESGDICVDGVSIYQNLRSWQNLVGYIPQSIFLIDDTIARNIAFGVPDELIDYQKLEKVIEAAQLTELIQELPEGVETSAGERGVRLSGGQRQRVGIARALYHDREILVLDEATAALDNETKQLITESIQSLSGSKTLIIIAHRLTTVKQCDRIYRLEEGKVIESGSYQKIVEKAS